MKTRWMLAMTGAFAATAALAGEMKLEVEYARSAIEVSGEAWGFIPADFAFRSFEAEVALGESGEDLAAAEFRFSYLDLSSGSRAKDERIQKWLEAERFPDGRFALERIEKREGRALAVGELTLHGLTRPASFEYTLARDEDGARLDAVARIDYRDWDLPTLRILLFAVDPALEIRIRVVGQLDANEE